MSYPTSLASTPANSLPQNSMVSNPRPTQPVAPLTRPALLGERPLLCLRDPHSAPGPPNPILQGPFPERARYPQPRMPTGPPQNRWPASSDPRTLNDQDLRQMPMSDRDMRPPPMLIGDKDMRQGPIDQDLRTMNVPSGIPDNRSFDPRFRNITPGEAPPMGAPNSRPVPMPDAPGFDRPRPGPEPYNVRGGPPATTARVEDPRGAGPPPTNPAAANARVPPNPRVNAVSGGSPAVGGASPNPNASPRPANNSLAAAAAAIAPHDQEKAALIMQVLQLSDQQIAMLPLSSDKV
ncbi:CSTF_C domain-containing protein [Caerostris extrusa]|uniref:CSTF_C domain-containing protein n=1 Tax=Caerostris extrusa TaxID=172846 RepID=A0AAV4MPN2_CAEEX|nr:CSTF_C domain-containing protein [Caerostris extrusa]